MRGLTEGKATLEHGDGLGDVPSAKGQKTNTATGANTAPWLSDRLGDLDRFIPIRTPLGERADLGETHDQPHAGEHRRRGRHAEALPFQRPP